MKKQQLPTYHYIIFFYLSYSFSDVKKKQKRKKKKSNNNRQTNNNNTFLSLFKHPVTLFTLFSEKLLPTFSYTTTTTTRSVSAESMKNEEY